MIALLELVDGPGIYADATGDLWMRIGELDPVTKWIPMRRLLTGQVVKFHRSGECYECRKFTPLIKKTHDIKPITGVTQ